MWQVSWVTAAGATFWIRMHKRADSQEVQLLLPVMWHSMLFWQKKMRLFWECLLGRNNIIVLYSVTVILDYEYLNVMQDKVFFFLRLWYSLHFALVSHKITWPESRCNTSEMIVFVNAAAIYITPITKCLAQVVQPCNDLILTQSQQRRQEL